MKKLYKSLFIWILAFSFVGSFSRVSAACDDNIFLGAFKSGEDDVNDALEQEESQYNVVTTINTFDTGKFVNINILATGSLGKCPTASAGTFLAENKDARGGIVMEASNAMFDTFLNPPSENIGGYYANMLLPKEVTQSGAYAANCGDPGLASKAPLCESASDFWSKYGISNLWGVSFTLAMLLVVVVLLISGFLIMFRSRIGGQTVVTVSMALQNVILGAVMSLASFAIGVFFVNLSKALMIVIANLFVLILWRNLGGSTELGQWISGTLGDAIAITYLSDPLGLFVKFMAMLYAGDMANFNSTANFFGVATSGGIIEGIKSIFSGGMQLLFFVIKVTTSPLFLLVRILIAGSLLVASIRIWWVVVKTYIIMVIDVVIAPVLFVVSAIPSKSTAVKDWLLRMLRNALTVPMMFAFVNATVFIVIKVAVAHGTNGGPVSDPIQAVTGGAVPLSTGGILVSLISPHAIIALVLLNMVPSIPGVMADLFSGKSSGALDKVSEATMKQLQKIPVAGSIFS